MADDPRSDYELLHAWAGGDRAAGNLLVRRHFGGVFGFFRSKLDDRPEDLTQRTFQRCLKNYERFRQDASMRAFLLGIARLVLLEHFRSLRRREEPMDPEVLAVRDVLETPSQLAARKEEQQLLLVALRAIPLDFQITLELFYWEEMGVEEVASVLEIRPGTVKSRLHRARELLRKQLDTLDVSDAIRRSTLDNLEEWAKGLRDALSDHGDE